MSRHLLFLGRKLHIIAIDLSEHPIIACTDFKLPPFKIAEDIRFKIFFRPKAFYPVLQMAEMSYIFAFIPSVTFAFHDVAFNYSINALPCKHDFLD